MMSPARKNCVDAVVLLLSSVLLAAIKPSRSSLFLFFFGVFFNKIFFRERTSASSSGETKVSKVSGTVSKAADDSFVTSTFDEPDVKADDLRNVLVKQNCVDTMMKKRNQKSRRTI